MPDGTFCYFCSKFRKPKEGEIVISDFRLKCPNRTFHNLKASRSGDRDEFYVDPERHTTDFEAPKLWKGLLGWVALSFPKKKIKSLFR